VAFLLGEHYRIVILEKKDIDLIISGNS